MSAKSSDEDADNYNCVAMDTELLERLQKVAFTHELTHWNDNFKDDDDCRER